MFLDNQQLPESRLALGCSVDGAEFGGHSGSRLGCVTCLEGLQQVSRKTKNSSHTPSNLFHIHFLRPAYPSPTVDTLDEKVKTL